MRQHNQGAQLRRTAASPAIIVGQETTGRITSFSAFLHNQDPQQTLAWSRDKKLCVPCVPCSRRTTAGRAAARPILTT